MSFFSKIGKALKKVLPIAAPLAALIPGVGPAVSGVLSTIGGGSSAQRMGDPNAGPQLEQVQVTGQSPGTGITDILKAGAPLAAGALNYYGAKQTNAANAQMAQQQMDFQAQQSSTSYQRGTADMKAAGLNPMLAYQQGGAGFGAGSSATIQNEVGAGANSALQAAETIASVKNMVSNNANIEAQTDNIDADTAQKRSQIALNAASAKKAIASAGLDTASARNAEETLQSIIFENARRAGTLKSEISLAGSRARLGAYAEPKAKNEAAAEGSWWKQNVSPYLPDIGGMSNSAAAAAKLF